MKHLEMHEHAFINKDNIIINIAVFQEQDHDSSLLDDIMKSIPDAVQVICCCTFGVAGIGGTWSGTEFIPPSLYKGWIWNTTYKEWVPPTPMPGDGPEYIWDNQKEKWVALE